MRIPSGLLAGTIVVATLTLASHASACLWDDETFHSEAESLPCVHDAVLLTFPQHSREFYEARIAAADAVLEWNPRDTTALDRKGNALLKLRKYDEAERVMMARAAVTPDAYAVHANLGTLFTFRDQLDKALFHIDRALAIDPNAHFGRERFHRLLVVYLQDLAAGRARDTENFFRIPVTDEDRAAGKDVLAERGVPRESFDALVSMVTVYGAQDVPHVFLTFGDLLSLRGSRRLAWAAYERARELKHPSSETIARWQQVLEKPIRAEQNERAARLLKEMDPEGRARGDFPDGGLVRGTLRDAYRSRKQSPGMATDVETSRAADAAARYTAWEKKEIAAGLPVWTRDGLSASYREAQRRVPRCKSPGVIDEEAVLP